MLRSNSRALPAGFTLMEVVVALAIGALAVSVAATLLAVTSDQVGLIRVRTTSADERANGERILRQLIGQMRWAREDEPTPFGDNHSLVFATRCEVQEGWQERCIVSLLASGSAGSGVLAILSTGDTLVLLRQAEVRGFAYVVGTDRGGTWSATWSDARELPPAIGIVLVGDTLIVRTGARG